MYFSLTISILYERFAKLQETVAGEASLLTLTDVSKSTLSVCLEPKCGHFSSAVDQFHILAVDNRSGKTMAVIYNEIRTRRSFRCCKLQEHGGTDDSTLDRASSIS